MSTAVTDSELHAYIDGELPPERVAEVTAAIARDPVLMGRERDFRADKLAMAAAYDHLASLPIPPALLASARNGPVKPVNRRRTFVFAFAGMAALAATLLLTLAPRTPNQPAVEQALAARDQTRTPSRELDGHAPATVEVADQAMSEMLGNPVRVPDLRRAGFNLVAADIYGGPHLDAVQLRYEDATRRLFTVFLSPSAGPDAFEVAQRGNVRLCVWQNADLTAVMTGEMSTPELFRLASLTYTSLGL
jgi:anti-sigma factor RsiW